MLLWDDANDNEATFLQIILNLFQYKNKKNSQVIKITEWKFIDHQIDTSTHNILNREESSFRRVKK